jgi:hypothetical protein
MNLADHPTVQHFHARADTTGTAPPVLDAAWLRQLCRACGADDAGVVELSRPALDDQRADILRVFPPTQTLLSFVCRMNRADSAARPGRSPTSNSPHRRARNVSRPPG